MQDYPELAEWSKDRIYDPDDLSQLINETSDLDRQHDQVQEEEVSICSDEELDTEVSTAETNSYNIFIYISFSYWVHYLFSSSEISPNSIF